MDVCPDRLREWIVRIASEPRPAESAELVAARSLVIQYLNDCGWTVRTHEFRTIAESGTSLFGVNIIATRGTLQPTTPRFCIGAHLDSIPNSPGADDNGTAVAALLEIARLLVADPPPSTVLEPELVFFDLEECGMLGGAEHAANCRSANVALQGMVSLEMLGYCDHSPGSQQLPRTLRGLYPDTGNFIAVVGNQNSSSLIDAFAHGMQTIVDLPVETLQVPSNGDDLQATRLSDHSPFWDVGYPALMITDTSFMRNPYYHTPDDTVDTLDMAFLHKVACGSYHAVRQILIDGLSSVPRPA